MKKIVATVSLGAAAALLLSSCSNPGEGHNEKREGALTIVASTNVYGNIAAQLGGDEVTVSSIITDESQNPHEFEASAQDQLSVAKADLIIENGGGYDGFMELMIEASGTSAPVLTAVDFSDEYAGEGAEEDGHAHDEEAHDHVEGFNEHVWYDLHTMEHFAEALTQELSALRPQQGALFEENLSIFTEQLEELELTLETLADGNSSSVFVTEPVPLYLVFDAGFNNVSPAAFSEAVEEGQDVSPAVLLDSLNLIGPATISGVIENTQAGGSETVAVTTKARESNVPVIAFSELLPQQFNSYYEWMKSNIEALSTFV